MTPLADKDPSGAGENRGSTRDRDRAQDGTAERARGGAEPTSLVRAEELFKVHEHDGVKAAVLRDVS